MVRPEGFPKTADAGHRPGIAERASDREPEGGPAMYRGQPEFSEDAEPANLIGAMPLAAHPTILGARYVLREMIGAGGSATVYRARDGAVGGDVAVKLFHANLSAAARRRHQ